MKTHILKQTLIITGTATAIGLLSGCSTYKTVLGYPPVGYQENKQIKQLSTYVDAKNANLDCITNIADRDDYISHRIVLIDLEYGKLLARVTGVKNGLDATKEIAVGTMGAVGGLLGGGTAEVLSAATAATTAANAGVDKVYFYNQTLPAIISAMNAGRKSVLATIADNKAYYAENETGPSYSDYTVQRAAIDLAAYYYAGTFAGAAQNIQNNSSQQTSTSEQKINTAKTAAKAKVKESNKESLTPLEKNALMLRNPTMDLQ